MHPLVGDPVQVNVEPWEFDDRALPSIETEAVDRCPLCGDSASARYAEGYDYELRTCRNRWQFVGCAACDHVWLNPRPRAGALPLIYPPTYYAYNYAQRVHPLAARGKAWLDQRKLAGILRHLTGAPRSYLDVGCGDGRFLRVLERAGVPRQRLFGLELDRRVADGLRGEGYQVECARVEGASIVSPGSLDLITMFHVIEHVEQPATIVAKLASWLGAGGVLALETPNRRSLDARLFRKTFWGGYHFPRHWHLFTTEGVERLLRTAGLNPVAIAYQTGHSFWLYSIHHWLRYGPLQLPRVARWFDPMGALIPLVAATAWDKVRALLGFRTSAVLVLGQKPVAHQGHGSCPLSKSG